MNFHIVAFIDVLGFSQMVKTDTTGQNTIYLPIFRDTISEVRASFDGADGLDAKMFSDSIIISAPLSPPNVQRLLAACIDLQQRFLRRGILLRGGISLGKHYSDENVTFSDALISAYRIESGQARFPRVVLDKNVIDYFENHPETTHQIKEETFSMIRKDRDSACFMHYLCGPNLDAMTEQVRQFISRARPSEETVLEKMRWLHDYHSYCATANGTAQMVIEGFQINFVELH